MNDEIQHHGVKGMKWGIRRFQNKDGSLKPAGKKKKDNGVEKKTTSYEVSTKYGDTLKVNGQPTPGFTKWLAKYIPKVKENVENSDFFKLEDKTGKTVGEMQLYKESPEELNIVWVGVAEGSRGNGYASAAINASIDHAKKQGVSKVTLEVPGNSPDAKHVYEKAGFKEVGKEPDYDEDDIWGGLTLMELNLDTKHSSIEIEEILKHHGVKGMKWGIRRYQPYSKGQRVKGGKEIGKATKVAQQVTKRVTSGAELTRQKAYAVGAKVNPRELKYGLKRSMNKVGSTDKELARMGIAEARTKGQLTTSKDTLKAIEKEGIEVHKKQQYSNLDSKDIAKLKKYTDAAYYSRGVNGYLAIGEPKKFEGIANDLKATIQKNNVSGQTVYRSLNMNFSTDGLAKKLSNSSQEELSKLIDGMSKNFKGKSVSENRVYSTSTSPLFAIDTWREVNPTAAKNYNAYMIIETNKTPGLFADGRTSNGKKIVNTRSNQEVILAPNKMTYKKVSWDKEREMFAIHMESS